MATAEDRSRMVHMPQPGLTSHWSKESVMAVARPSRHSEREEA